MIELCGAHAAPGTIDVGGPGPAAADDPAARRAGRRPARDAIPRERCARDPPGARIRDRRADDGLDVTVPAFRRGDVTREADLIEEVARLGGARAAAGHAARAPRRLGPADRRASGCAAAPPTRSPRRACTRSSAGASPAPSWPSACGSPTGRAVPWRTRCPPSSRSCAPRCWARCWTSPSATAPAAPATCGCSRPAPSTCRPGRAARRALSRRRAADRRRCGRPTWREPEPAAADFFAAKGVLAGLLDTLRVPLAVAGREPSRSCTRAARARDPRRRPTPSAGWGRSIRSSRPSGT